jgi:hypothetical protein
LQDKTGAPDDNIDCGLGQMHQARNSDRKFGICKQRSICSSKAFRRWNAGCRCCGETL